MQHNIRPHKNIRQHTIRTMLPTRVLRGLIPAGLLLAGGLMNTALAGEPVIFRGAPPSAEQLADIMFPERMTANAASNPRLGRTRAIVFNNTQQAPAPAPAAQEEAGSFGFPINFAFDSVEVLPDSRAYLDQVGQMLKLPQVADQTIVIEGHTDASGSEGYNQSLSQRRAQAVRQYLQEKHGIDPSRLRIVGKGESELLAGVGVNDPVNRRVQFQRAY